MTSQEDKDLEAIYGPMASHSDHKRGDRIRYLSAEGLHCEGEIIWCCAPGMVGNEFMGLRYIVAPDPPTGFIDVAFPSDILT